MNKLLQQLNIVDQCRRCCVGLWSCPQFLFMAMGIVIVAAALTTHFIGQHYTDPEIVALIVLLLSGFLFLVGYAIVGASERLVEARIRETAQSKELLRLKDQFIFVAAHELRTPTSAIKWGLESLQKRQSSFTNRERGLLDMIRKNNEGLLVLVKNLLEVARIEGKTITINITDVSVSQVVSGAFKGLQNLIEEKGVIIHNEIPENFSLVLGDLARLKEVIAILLSNAIQYNKESGGVRISVEKKNDRAVICVADNGIGIAPKEQRHIFEKFWRAKNIQGVEGTGLGLFIGKQLVELMSGKIWFKSKEGKGTTFCVEIPMSGVKKDMNVGLKIASYQESQPLAENHTHVRTTPSTKFEAS